MIFKTIVILLEIIVSYLLQVTVFTNLRLADVVPDVLMILTVSLGYIVGKKTGALVGFTCGFLLDCTYGSLVGLFALAYSFLGYVSGYANKIYDSEDYTLPLFIIGGAEFLFNLFYFICFFMLKGDVDIGHYLVRFLFPRVIYTTMVSIIIFRLLNLNHGLFNRIDAAKAKRSGGVTYDFNDFDLSDRRKIR